MLRFDHVGVIVEDFDAAVAFFLELGFERDGGTRVSGALVDAINGLDGVDAELVMLRAPGGGSKLEVVRYHAPPDAAGDRGVAPAPANRPGLRHLCVEVADLDGLVARLAQRGHGLVGEVRDYGTSYRLCYLRGPEGIIVELAQALGG